MNPTENPSGFTTRSKRRSSRPAVVAVVLNGPLRTAMLSKVHGPSTLSRAFSTSNVRWWIPLSRSPLTDSGIGVRSPSTNIPATCPGLSSVPLSEYSAPFRQGSSCARSREAPHPRGRRRRAGRRRARGRGSFRRRSVSRTSRAIPPRPSNAGRAGLCGSTARPGLATRSHPPGSPRGPVEGRRPTRRARRRQRATRSALAVR